MVLHWSEREKEKTLATEGYSGINRSTEKPCYLELFSALAGSLT